MPNCINCNKTFQSERKTAKYCCNSCKTAYSRRSKEEDLPYSIVPGKKVYHRQAVIFKDEEEGVKNSLGAEWTTRPEPENPTDVPNKDNQCIYTRANGSRYIIDASGEVVGI